MLGFIGALHLLLCGCHERAVQFKAGDAELPVIAALVAVAERDALLELQSCPTQWCKVAAGDVRGWVSRTSLWGLVKDEVLN